MSDRAQGLRPEALDAFWGWWASAKDFVASAIAEKSLGESPVVGYISTAVHNLHPDLAWELGPGRNAQHNLTVSPEGNVTLRRLTQQWLGSAPPPDGTWEYYASRQPSGALAIEISGHRFASEEFRIAYTFDRSRERLDVELFHPKFRSSNDQLTRQVLFLTLDQCLGEDDVERWIGSIQAAKSQPTGALRLEEFVLAVAETRKVATGEQYTLGQGKSRDGKPVLISVNSALKQIDHLDHVFHLVIAIVVPHPDGNGFPSKEDAETLNRAEDALLAALGANAVQIGRVTWAGRREIHMFIRDATAGAATVDGWIAQIRPLAATSGIAFDPEWSAAKVGIYAALASRR